jgi:hypothetical protein
MKKAYALLFGLLAFVLVQPAWADSSSCVTTRSTISCVGNSTAPENVFTEPFTSGGTTLTIQTFGFGGGTNAAGMVISEGSFMPSNRRFAALAGDRHSGPADFPSPSHQQRFPLG